MRKFFLHVSKKEQKRRFLERIDDPLKNWKFSSNDAAERDYWYDYMEAYEEMIQETATTDAPWYVVPADNKWFTRVIVAGAVIETLASMLATKLNRSGQQEELSSMQPYDQGPIATATKPIYSAHNSTINSLNI